MFAAIHGRNDVAKALLDNGADPNQVDYVSIEYNVVIYNAVYIMLCFINPFVCFNENMR